MRSLAVVVSLLAIACTTQRTTATPVDLTRHAAELVRDGRAEVTTETGVLDVDANELVTVRIADGALQQTTTLTVRALVEGCVGSVGSPGCLASRTPDADAPTIRRTHWSFSPRRAATAATFGLIGGGIGYCLATCNDNGDFAKGATYVIVAGVVFVGVYVLAMMVD